MKPAPRHLPCLTLTAAALHLISSAAHSQELLAVDFGSAPSGVEAGFVGQTAFSQTHTTSAGDITVSFSGQQGFFVYAGGGTNPALFDDFVFDNSGPMTMTLTGPGISPGTTYELKVWSYYGVQARNTTVTGISGTSGTTLGPIAFDNPPTSLDDNSATGNFTSDGSGNLTFSLGAGRPAINGFRLTVGGADTTPPTLTGSDIVDDQSGGPVTQGAPVTYTVTFSEDMDDTTVEATDFGNAGTATFTIGTISETSPGVFSVEVTPTSTGTLELQVNQSAVLNDAAGNPLDTSSAIVDDTSLTVDPPDTTNPTLSPTDIVDDQSGGPVDANVLVTYTVTFSEDMDNTTVEATDFGNAGSSIISLGSISETSPGVFSVEVTPTTAGTLQLQINQSAVLADASGNPLNTSSAILDDTTITVNPPDTTPPTLAGSDIVDDQGGGSVTENSPVTYTVTFSEDMDDTTVDGSDFGNTGTAPIIVGAVTETSPGVFTVVVTPTAPGTLQLQVNASAVLDDAFGNPLETTTAISDDTTITVNVSTTTTILAVDFGGASNPVEAGFVGQSSTSFTHSTAAGDVKVDITGVQGLFDFTTNAGTTHADFFRDFYFKNGGSMTLTLSGPGITANTSYELTFWAFYGAEARNTTITATAGTIGTSLGPIAYEVEPTSLSQNSASGTFTSDGSGTLTFTLSGTSNRPAINGLRLEGQIGSPGTDYSDWIAGFPGVGGQTGFGDDPDGDGNGNGLENFFGTPPDEFSAGLVAGAVSGGSATFSHPQNPNPADDITAPVYMWSKDLVTFYASGESDGSTTVTFTPSVDDPVAGTTTVTAAVTGDPAPTLFMKVSVSQIIPPPPLLSEDFEADDGGFTATGTPNDWAYGTPNSDNDLSLVLTTGNDGSTNCWGTNLGTGGTPSGLIDPAADSILRSPNFDMSSVTGATLSFAAAVDAQTGDAVQVLLRNAGDDSLITTLDIVDTTSSGVESNWTDYGPLDISAGAGSNVYLEFRFSGGSNQFIGLYIDDVVVNPTP